MEANQARLILCTAPNVETARSLGRALVDAQLVACVTLIPGATSIYRWEGETHEEMEVQMLFKTRTQLLDGVMDWIEREHPYDTPEVLVLKPCGGSQAYLDWIATATPDSEG